MIRCDRQKTHRDCVLQKAYSDSVTTPYFHSLGLLFLGDAAGFVSLVNVNHAAREVLGVTWLIWLPLKCALCEMSCSALHLQRSHCSWHPTLLEPSLMLSQVTVCDQVQVQICYVQVTAFWPHLLHLKSTPLFTVAKVCRTNTHPHPSWRRFIVTVFILISHGIKAMVIVPFCATKLLWDIFSCLVVSGIGMLPWILCVLWDVWWDHLFLHIPLMPERTGIRGVWQTSIGWIRCYATEFLPVWCLVWSNSSRGNWLGNLAALESNLHIQHLLP